MDDNSYIIQILKDSLQSCSQIAADADCESLVKELNSAAGDISQPMHVAIIGKISSSKSTLVNAIIGEEELVSTGNLELTYNVSWLKYGDSDTDVKIVFNDGKCRNIPRSEWKLWANQNVDNLKTGVKYIEVTCHHELLRKINIIDTPGLFSTKGFDSTNTIQFLKEVKPDAVLLLSPDPAFAQAAIDILDEFQGHCITGNYHLTPLNAIGIFAKIDAQWRFSKHNGKSAIEVVKSEVEKSRKDVLLKSSLYSVFPICSKLALACSTLISDDVQLIKELLPSPDYNKMLGSVAAFTHSSINTTVSVEDRRYLLNKFDVYGVYELGKAIENGNEDIESLKCLLNKVSGFDDFMYVLNSHFGERSVLIKAQNAVRNIVSACREIRKQPNCEPEVLKCCSFIESKIMSTVLGLHEYKELDLLNGIYAGESANMDDATAIEEFKRVSEEYGGSLMDKLNKGIEHPIEEMLSYAENRATHWRKLYIICKTRKPKNAELYNVLSESYKILVRRVQDMIEEKRAAETKLKLIKQYIYGNKI